VWFAVDDKHEKTFLEKNLKEIEKNKDVVKSISNVEYFGMNLKKINKEGFFQKIKNKVKYRFDKKLNLFKFFHLMEHLKKGQPPIYVWINQYGTYLTFSDIIQIISNRE